LVRKLRDVVKGIESWAEAGSNYRSFPWRKRPTPYRVLVAELLLRRTTAAAVQRVYEDFLAAYPDLDSLSGANNAELEAVLKTIGYHKSRAIIFKEVASDLISKYGGIPDSLENLLAVKNIGLYTAAAIISLGYCRPLPMVDTNVTRVLSRVLDKKISQKEAFLALRHVLPHDYKRFNLSLLDFGASVCTYGVPLCYKCPVAKYCSYEPKSAAPTVQ
jgi:A/G-specific adenine glycosylase